MNKTFEEIMQLADELPDGDYKISLLEEAIRLADAQQDVDKGYIARMHLTRVAHNAGRGEKALLSFAWCLAQYDKKPERYNEHNIMWHYKWIASRVHQFPQISLDKIDETLEDLRRRYQSLGYTLNIYYKLRHEFALSRGDFESANYWFEKWIDEPRDEISDCIACDLNDQAYFLLTLGKFEEAWQKARPIFLGQVSCQAVPHNTYADFLIPLLIRGRVEEAKEFHRKGYEMVRMEQGFLRSISQHLYYLIAVDLKRAITVFETHLPEALASNMPRDRFDFFLAGWILMDHLDEETIARMALPVPVNKEWLITQVREIARQFDQRNQNDHYKQLIDQVRGRIEQARIEYLAWLEKQEQKEEETADENGPVVQLIYSDDSEPVDWKNIEQQANDGDEDAMFVLSGAILAREIPGKTSKEGIQWLRKAVESGHPTATYILSKLHFHGDFVEQNRDEAMRLLKRSAELGDPHGMLDLGLHLMEENCLEEGIEWIRKAAETKTDRAMYHYGYSLLHGIGTEKNPQEAAKWLKEAAEQGHVPAMDLMALLYLEGEVVSQNREEGERLLRQAAEAGFPSAMHQLGYRLIEGDVLEKNREEGEKWLRQAANADYDLALLELAYRLLEGDGVKPNSVEGEVLLRRAAHLGNPEAMFELARRLFTGEGIPSEPEEGLFWLEKAAKEGHPRAMYLYGVHLYEGIYMEENKEEGRKWIERAAEAGEERAIEYLQEMDSEV